MAERSLSFFARVWLALIAPWRILFDGAFAARVAEAVGMAPKLPAGGGATGAGGSGRSADTSHAADDGRREGSAAAPAKAGSAPARVHDAAPEAALQLLGLLQREGRFVDFVMEDVTGFSDAEIGAAARVVHDGCARALREYLPLVSIRDEPEESRVTLPVGYDAAAVRVTGNVTGKPPFTGTLKHRGWRVEKVRLPTLADGHDATVIAPAEVEL
jgi:hypothetical protein